MYRDDAGDARGLTAAGGTERDLRLPRASRALKRTVDVVGAAVFLVLLLPVFLVALVGVRLSSPGPIFFVQSRIGEGGKRFSFYKFRSMRVDAEQVLSSFLDSDPVARQQWAKYQKIDRDPRITPFGAFLRRTSLDELPQFWNVIVGDMSLVGPRPCMPQQVELYGAAWPAYCAVKPGITGLWQVSGRNKLTYAQRVVLDARYVRDWSLQGDFRILARTCMVVLRAQGQ